MSNEVYNLIRPTAPRAGIVINSPHSGRDYPDHFVASSDLTLGALRSSEDAYVDELFADAPGLGLPLMAARFPRAFVDLNRGSDELDPALIRGLSGAGVNPRVASGLGVIPRVVAEGRAIRSGKMSLLDARARLARYYWPYHQQLSHLLDQTRSRFGTVLLLDCHSMPSYASGNDRIGYDVVLGDRFGASAAGEYVDMAEAILTDLGLKVGRNTPFAGAHLAQRYGNPVKGQHVIQIEVNRGLYLNEELVTLSEGFIPLRQKLSALMGELIAYMSPDMSLAAE
ncbi:MAG: N-formylglutamate amidohydrolase [Pseudomonadota bacterium]